MPLRHLAIATLIDLWSAVRWHTYLLDIGPDLRVWSETDMFVRITSLAIALGAFLLTCAIAYEPPAALPPAWVPRRLQRLRLRAPAQFAIVLALMLPDCRRASSPPDHESVVIELESPPEPEPEPFCGFDESPGCQAMVARTTYAPGRIQ